MLADINAKLLELANPEVAKSSLRFFKVGRDQYGYGDKFLGIRNPKLKQLVKLYKAISLSEIALLLKSPYHEARLLGLMLMVYQYQHAKSLSIRTALFEHYLAHVKQVNNWDLVDASCYKILGDYLYDRDRSILYKFASSSSIWERRISIVSTYYFIQKSDLSDTFIIASKLLDDKEDLIHKAVGWMLKEAGKRQQRALLDYLSQHKSKMPRTALRCAIEKLDEEQRQLFLAK